jgi:hypothetical protein
MSKIYLFSVAWLLAAFFYWTLVSDRTHKPYPRVDHWIQAAQCAQSSGKYMVTCTEHRLVPIEDVSLADDRGHTLILSALAHLGGIQPTHNVLRVLNLSLNALGVLLISLLLHRFRLPLAAAAMNALGAIWTGSRAGADVDAAYLAAALFALGGCFFLFLMTSGDPDQVNAKKVLFPATFVHGVLTFLLLMTSVFLRQPIGLSGIVAALAGICFLLLSVRKSPFRRTYLLRSILALGIIWVALQSPKSVAELRNRTLDIQPKGISGHGISHNLFLGLGGYVENKFGIIWDDQYAKNLIERLYPGVEYCSDEYFRLIGKLYLQYVKSDPAEALRIYLLKAGRTLGTAHGATLPSAMTLILLGLTLWYRQTRGIIHSNQEKLLIGTTTLLGLSFLAQGILTHPAWTYIHPGPMLLILALLMALDPAVQRLDRFQQIIGNFRSIKSTTKIPN